MKGLYMKFQVVPRIGLALKLSALALGTCRAPSPTFYTCTTRQVPRNYLQMTDKSDTYLSPQLTNYLL